MHTILYFYFCMHYTMNTTKNLVSICHHIVASFTHVPFPLVPSLLVTTTLFSVSIRENLDLIFNKQKSKMTTRSRPLGQFL